MTTRRTFITGLLASAATGAAQPVPAQPVADFLATPKLIGWGTGTWGETIWPTLATLNGVYGKLLPVPSQPVNAALLDKLYQARRLARAESRVSSLMRGAP